MTAIDENCGDKARARKAKYDRAREVYKWPKAGENSWTGVTPCGHTGSHDFRQCEFWSCHSRCSRSTKVTAKCTTAIGFVRNSAAVCRARANGMWGFLIFKKHGNHIAPDYFDINDEHWGTAGHRYSTIVRAYNCCAVDQGLAGCRQ